MQRMVERLARESTQQALRHLPMLEPAYAAPGTVAHPPATAAERRAVCHAPDLS